MLPDGVLLFEAQSGFALTAAEGGEGSCSAGYVHVFCREEYGRPGQQTVRNISIFRFIVFTSVMFRCRAFLHPGPTPRSVGFANGILVPERFIYPGGKVSQKQIIHLTSFNIAIMITKKLISLSKITAKSRELKNRSQKKEDFHGNCVSGYKCCPVCRSDPSVLEKNFQEYDDHKTPEGAGCFSDCTGRLFLYPVPFRCIGYQGRILSRTRVFECFLCPGVSFPCCVRPVGFNEKKGKACPDNYLRLRSPDRGAMLCFSI